MPRPGRGARGSRSSRLTFCHSRTLPLALTLEEPAPPLPDDPGLPQRRRAVRGRLTRSAACPVRLRGRRPPSRLGLHLTLAGGDFRAILDAIDTSATAASGAATGGPDDAHHPDDVVDRRRRAPAGGWLARCWMGSRPYSGGVVYAGAARVRTLLTLGTPHYSLERYPSDESTERRERDGLEQADDVHDETYETYANKTPLRRGRRKNAQKSLRSEALATLRARARPSRLALTSRIPASRRGVGTPGPCCPARAAPRVFIRNGVWRRPRAGATGRRRARRAVFAGVSYASSRPRGGGRRRGVSRGDGDARRRGEGRVGGPPAPRPGWDGAGTGDDERGGEVDRNFS